MSHSEQQSLGKMGFANQWLLLAEEKWFAKQQDIIHKKYITKHGEKQLNLGTHSIFNHKTELEETRN